MEHFYRPFTKADRECFARIAIGKRDRAEGLELVSVEPIADAIGGNLVFACETVRAPSGAVLARLAIYSRKVTPNGPGEGWTMRARLFGRGLHTLEVTCREVRRRSRELAEERAAE